MQAEVERLNARKWGAGKASIAECWVDDCKKPFIKTQSNHNVCSYECSQVRKRWYEKDRRLRLGRDSIKEIRAENKAFSEFMSLWRGKHPDDPYAPIMSDRCWKRPCEVVRTKFER